MDAAPLPELGLLRRSSTYSLTGFNAHMAVSAKQTARLLCAPGTYEVQLSDATVDMQMTAHAGGYAVAGKEAMTRSDLILGAES